MYPRDPAFSIVVFLLKEDKKNRLITSVKRQRKKSGQAIYCIVDKTIEI